MMFLSVVIPVYNVERYLKQCVESILAQTMQDFEIILVDDGSKDGSGALCDGFAANDKRIQVIHKENGGQALARNVGTEKAQGEYLIYIDSDDFIMDEHFFEKLQQAAGSGADIICYKFKKYYESPERYLDCPFTIPAFTAQEDIAARVEALVKHDAFYCAPWTKAMKRSLLTDHDVHFVSGLLSEDQQWYYEVILNAEHLEGIDECFIAYRQRENSTSGTWKIKNLTDTIDIIERMVQKIGESDKSEAYKTALMHSVAKLYCNLLIGYSRYTDKQKKQYRKKLKELSYLLKYNLNPRVKSFGKIYALCGFSGLMTGLSVLAKIR